MSEEVEDPLSVLTDKDKSDVIVNSSKEVSCHDILVCGKCHQVYHYVEEFEKHKTNEEECKENDDLKETLKDEKKPQIWAFTLWKNTKFRDVSDENKLPSSWSIYQLWCNLASKEKDAWLTAAEKVQSLFEIALMFEKVKLTAMNRNKTVMDTETVESEEQNKKNDVDADSQDGKDDKKPVVLNSKLGLRTVNLRNNTKKAVRTGSNTEYTVEKILLKRYHPRRKTFEYFIKWETLDTEKNTWEATASLVNCKQMVDEFEKNLAIQKAQEKLQKMQEKKLAKKAEAAMLMNQGRPQRTSKQKALNQVKQWCGNMESDDLHSNKRVFSDDSDEDEEFEKRLKYEEYSSDSENEASPVVTIKRVQKSQNGVEKKLTIGTKVIDPLNLPDNILIPDAQGVVRINQKQIPSLSSGVYVMSKTAGIIKLDTQASKLATSGGQTVLKVAPKIGQTSIKVIKKEMPNGTPLKTTTNILRSKPAVRSYGRPPGSHKKTIVTVTSSTPVPKKPDSPFTTPEKEHKSGNDDESDDGIEEMKFPDEPPVVEPESPPSQFTLCPLTGKVLDKDGNPIEEPEPEPRPNIQIKAEQHEAESDVENGAAALDNLVNLAAADILQDFEAKDGEEKKDESSETITDADSSVENAKPEPMEIDSTISRNTETIIKMETSDANETTTKIIRHPIKSDGHNSILSTALSNANIPIRRPSNPSVTTVTTVRTVRTPAHQTVVRTRPSPQAIITRITPANNSGMIARGRSLAPRPSGAQPGTSIIRKRIVHPVPSGSRGGVRRFVDGKVYSGPSSSGAIHQVHRITKQVPVGAVATTAATGMVLSAAPQTPVATTLVSTPASVASAASSTHAVISMPSLDGDLGAAAAAEKITDDSTQQLLTTLEDDKPADSVSADEPPTILNSGVDTSSPLQVAADADAPLLITGEDGTIYQVAGQNEDGQTILITQGEDGEQQCLLVAPENAGIISQVLMKSDAPVATTTSPAVDVTSRVEPEPEIEAETATTEDAGDDSQVVAQIVSANPPSPGGTRKVVLMLPDGNFMMTEVTAEQYAALELDK